MNIVNKSNNTRVMVSFPFSEGKEIERMYAINLGIGSSQYILDNVPFYVYGLSVGDTFEAISEDDGSLFFSKIIEHGGHSTYRVKLPAGKDHDFFLSNWVELEKMGCSFEGSAAAQERLYAIDLPPGIDVNKAYNILVRKEDEGAWVFEEGHYFDKKI